MSNLLAFLLVCSALTGIFVAEACFSSSSSSSQSRTEVTSSNSSSTSNCSGGGQGQGGNQQPPPRPVNGTVRSQCGSYDDTNQTTTTNNLGPGGTRQGPHNLIMPWMVLVVTESNKTCPGVIINNQWVATIQSCVSGAKSLTIAAGVLFANNSTNNQQQCGPPQGANGTQGGPGGSQGGPGGSQSGPPSGGSQGGQGGPGGSQSGPPSGGSQGQSGPGGSQGGMPPPPPNLLPRVTVAATIPAVNDGRYNSTTGAYNVALIKLSTTLDFSQADIQPVCLPSNASCQQQTSGTSGRAMASSYTPRGQYNNEQFTQGAVQFTVVNGCSASVSTNMGSIGGGQPTILTSPSNNNQQNGVNPQRLMMFPNSAGGLFTMACCEIDFIQSTVGSTLSSD